MLNKPTETSTVLMETFRRNYSLLLLLLLLLLFCSIMEIQKCQAFSKTSNSSATAVLVFGDSTVDPGNNNFIKTIFKGNFPPYGKDFPDEIPTGRFSNGRLTPDFIASYAGIKEFVPPYLDPSLSIEELMTGVSFASAGSGFDPLTPQISNVISVETQIEYFKEYKKKLESAMGKKKAESHLKKALFIISCGTNDFVVNYLTLPIRRKTFTVSAYQQFILHKALDLIQVLVEEGARRILFTEISPMGCLPVVITIFSKNVDNAILERKCIDSYSLIGKQFNQMLQGEVNLIQSRSANLGVKIGITPTYATLDNLIRGTGKSAFDEVSSGCCGTGYLEAGILCNPNSIVCSDASKYVFWDSIHPTQTTYYNIFQALRPTVDFLISDP